MSEIRTELATTKLRNIDTSTIITDLGYDFCYKRIRNPKDERTDAFNLFYKDHDADRWLTHRGVLTDTYIVVKTEEAIKQIQKNLNSTITSQKYYRYLTSVKCSFVLSDFDINVDPDSPVDKLMFKLITNITADIDVLTSAKLSFNVINGYSGTHALQLNYGILKKISHQNREVNLNNVFILDEFTKRLIHDNRMILGYEDIVNVQKQIQSKINIFKQIKVTDEFIKNFQDYFPKKFVKKFMALYDSLSIEFRNFYYCTFVWSALLDAEKKITTEIRLRAFVFEHVKQFLLQQKIKS